MRSVERLNCKCITCDGKLPTNQLVMIPLHVIFISGNTLVSVTGITLVIDRLFVLNELSLE